MAIQIHTQSREDSNNRAMFAPPTRTTSGVTLRPISLGSLEILRQRNNSLASADADMGEIDTRTLTEFLWVFDNLKLNGRKLRICLMASSTTTELNTSLILSGLGVYNDSDGCYLTNSSGSTEKYLICATFDLDSPGPLFVPIDHVDDITSHLSESEHTGLSELLANKDALLALLNS